VRLPAAIAAILLGLLCWYAAAVHTTTPARTPSRPATEREIRQHDLERLLELHQVCGTDRVTPPCDELKEN